MRIAKSTRTTFLEAENSTTEGDKATVDEEDTGGIYFPADIDPDSIQESIIAMGFPFE